jgi:ketosteroid isomerase-like protein
MSEADVAIIRGAFVEAAEGDVGVFFRVSADDVCVYPRPAQLDAAQEYHGLEGLMEYLTSWFAEWEEYDFELEELRDAGDHVLAVVLETGRSPAGLEVQDRFSHSFRLRDGKVVEWHMYDSYEDALAAVEPGG